MPGSSRKHPPDKGEFIAPTDDIHPSEKPYQLFKSLKHYLKELYSNVKAL